MREAWFSLFLVLTLSFVDLIRIFSQCCGTFLVRYTRLLRQCTPLNQYKALTVHCIIHVSIPDTTHYLMPATYGVLQWSVIGPFLFLIHVEVVFVAVSSCCVASEDALILCIRYREKYCSKLQTYEKQKKNIYFYCTYILNLKFWNLTNECVSDFLESYKDLGLLV